MSDAKPLILVVDDDRLVLATVVAGLRQAEFEIIEADNGDDAILLARKYKPVLAILDMRMQGKSGMDVARYLAANTTTGFMFLSAFGDSDIIEEATRLGALGYLVKPLDVKQIVPAVRAALARVQERGPPSPPRTGSELRVPTSSRPSTMAPDGGVREQHVAIGILMERLRLDYDRAFEALRAQARSEGRSVDDLAVSMLNAANRSNSV
jgi:two-component system, response regulator PdtaR